MNKKLYANTVVSLITQVVTIVCGLILPRIILRSFGSEINGLVSSISQFLAVITLLDMGVGAVVQAALYKPLNNNNFDELSRIVKSSDRFFHRIGLILFAYVLVLCFIYPFLGKSSFDLLFTDSLLVIIAISSFLQYFWGVTNQILLNADQKIYITSGLQCIVLVLNTIICSVLSTLGASIHVVKLASALIFVVRPLCMHIYVKRNYRIDRKIKILGEPITQKWNGLSQHIASYVLDNTDVLVLTVFSSLNSVSIYTVYFNVANGIRKLLMASFTSFQSMWGNLLAKGDLDSVNSSFHKTEWLLHNVVVVLFGITGFLIVPFVKIYTSGVNDISYIYPLFATLLVLASAAHCLRLPYMMMVYASGAFKETQTSAWIEAGINILLSILLVVRYDLIGVAIGTLIAMLYRTIYLAVYLSRHILNRKIYFFLKRLLLDFICLLIFCSLIFLFNINQSEPTITGWLVLAIKTSVVIVLSALVVNVVFERKMVVDLFTRISNRFRLRKS